MSKIGLHARSSVPEVERIITRNLRFWEGRRASYLKAAVASRPGLCLFNPAIDRLSKNSAYHAADQAGGTATVAVMASTAPAAMTRAVIGFVGAAGVRRGDDFGLQCGMLRHVEEASFGIAARRLPARDNGAGRLVEFSVRLGIEAEARQAALNVATFCLVEPDPVFGFLARVGEDRGVDGCHLIADVCTRTGFGNASTDESYQD